MFPDVSGGLRWSPEVSGDLRHRPQQQQLTPAYDLDELVEDAFFAIPPGLERIRVGDQFEDAPFVFVGHSVGAQVLAPLARKLRSSSG